MQSFRDHVLSLFPEHAEGAEVGVWKGDFSERILSIAKPRRLHLIDPFETRHEPTYDKAWYGAQSAEDMAAIRSGVENRFSEDISTGRVILHAERSEDALAKLPDGSLDFIYIDGDHTYEAVAADLAQSFRVCRDGGLICLDDYVLGRWWQDGVVRAANSFLGAHATKCQIVLCHAGQLVIQKRDVASQDME